MINPDDQDTACHNCYAPMDRFYIEPDDDGLCDTCAHLKLSELSKVHEATIEVHMEEKARLCAEIENSRSFWSKRFAKDTERINQLEEALLSGKSEWPHTLSKLEGCLGTFPAGRAFLGMIDRAEKAKADADKQREYYRVENERLQDIVIAQREEVELFIDVAQHHADELAKGRYNCAWLVIGWVALLDSYRKEGTDPNYGVGFTPEQMDNAIRTLSKETK